MSKTPKSPPGRALTDDIELSDDELDRVIGGAGPGIGRADENDGWSEIVDDHSKKIPVGSRPSEPARPASEPRDKPKS